MLDPLARRIALSLILALCSGGLHAAQPEHERAPEPATPRREEPDAPPLVDGDSPEALTLNASLRATYQADTDFDADIGELQLTEYHAAVEALIHPGSGQLSVGLGSGLLDYDITPGAGSVAGDAASIGAEFDEIYTLSLTGIYSNRFNESTGWFVGGGVLSAFESDADFGDSLDWLVTAGFTHTVSDKLEVGIGVAVRSRLDDDVLVVPVPRIRYTIDEHWSLESQRVGLRLNYKSSERLSYGVSGEYDTVSFRLDDTHAAAPEGMATHRRFPVALYAVYQPQPRIEITGRLGAAFAGELEILDTEGGDIAKQDLDTAVFGSLGVSFRF